MRSSILFLLLGAFFLVSCGPPAYNPADSVSEQAIIDDTNNLLTTGQCASAVAEILPLYNSAYSNNQVREITASAYGCSAGINFFVTLGDIASDASTIGSNFWGFFAQLFPSTSADKVVESAGYGMEVLLTVMPTGQIVAPSDIVGAGSYNPGSLNEADRISDANLYMLLMSMAAIGGPLSRNATATFQPISSTAPLPWNDNITHMTYQGCTFASGLMNFLDVLTVAPSLVSASSATVLTQISSVLNVSVLNLACNYGCKGTVPAGADGIVLNSRGNWVATGCTLASGCNASGGCPTTLKDINMCNSNVITDPTACAAAGIVNFINSSAAGWI